MMVALRPTIPITISIPAITQTQLMASMFMRYFCPSSVTGSGKATKIDIRRLFARASESEMVKKSTLLQRLVSHTVGLVVLYTYALVILVDGGWKVGWTSKKERTETLAASRTALWGLHQEPYPGVKHHFHTDARTDVTIHYVEAGDTCVESELVVMLHGFPDSFYTFRHQLTSQELRNAHLIAPDLPGFGGSGSLPSYSPDHVLTALHNFIAAMKRRKGHDRCILVGHDWGATIACRLASECPKGTFTRVIILSGLHPTVLAANASYHLSAFRTTLHSSIWVHHPLHIVFHPSRAKRDLGRLTSAWCKHIMPLLRQARCSHYVFAFKLPYLVFARLLPTMANHWAIRSQARSAKSADELTFLANSLGPGPEDCSDQSDYPESVSRRKGSEMDSMISYYRDGLASLPWSQRWYRQPGEECTTKPGRFKCPVIAVWGARDQFFCEELVRKGWGRYMCYDADQAASATVVLERSGHWFHVGGRGKHVVAAIMSWAVEEARCISSGRECELVRDLERLIDHHYVEGDFSFKCY